MGREIFGLVKEEKDLRIICGIEKPGHPMIDEKFGEVAIVKDPTPFTNQANCVVDFSAPAVTMSYLEKLSNKKLGWVIGTTGFSDAERKKIRKYSKKFPIMIAPNMSLGVNVLFELVKMTTQRLRKGYDTEIIEMHHRYKRDAPSGTAKKLAEIIKSVKGGTLVSSREGIVGPRKENEIGIMALRGGDVVGDHTVIFATEGERLELKHSATSRKAFSRGVVWSARFIVKQKCGFFTMSDVINRLVL